MNYLEPHPLLRIQVFDVDSEKGHISWASGIKVMTQIYVRDSQFSVLSSDFLWKISLRPSGRQS